VSSRTCAYCGSGANLTREHLWPACLHNRLLEANKLEDNCFWLRKIHAEIQGEPTIKDVCQSCNNGPLSQLDSYVCTLFDIYFQRILNRHELVWFEYDYHLLKRWLLKLSFNSARMHNSLDVFAYGPLLDYINGGSTSKSAWVEAFLQLSYPGVIPAERLADPELHDAPPFWRPEDNRLGFMHFAVPGVGRKVLRVIHLRSYTFYLAFFEPGSARATVREFARVFQANMPEAVLLAPSRQGVEVKCNRLDAWASYDGARENSFEWIGNDRSMQNNDTQS
jgi:hypothetical protein